jgi:hypothetical protein
MEIAVQQGDKNAKYKMNETLCLRKGWSFGIVSAFDTRKVTVP